MKCDRTGIVLHAQAVSRLVTGQVAYIYSITFIIKNLGHVEPWPCRTFAPSSYYVVKNSYLYLVETFEELLVEGFYSRKGPGCTFLDFF